MLRGVYPELVVGLSMTWTRCFLLKKPDFEKALARTNTKLEFYTGIGYYLDKNPTTTIKQVLILFCFF
jgi:hypothetical protein